MQLDTPLTSISVCHDKRRDELRVEGSLRNVTELARASKLSIRLHGMKFGTPRFLWQKFRSAIHRYSEERVDVILSEQLGTGRRHSYPSGRGRAYSR